MHLIDRDKKYVWHPFTPQKDMAAPIAVVQGKGSLLFDEDGNSYIDAISSWWVTLHGHGHPYIAEKIYQQALQLEQVIFAGFTHEPAEKLAKKLLPHIPYHSKIFYSDNGSTAVEVAIKMALQYWKNKGEERKKIICFRDAYHGDTFGSMSVSARGIFTNPFQKLLFDVEFIDTPNDKNENKVIEQLNQLITNHQPLITDDFANGVYFVTVTSANGTSATKKLIIQK